MTNAINIIGAPHPAEFNKRPIRSEPDHAPMRFEDDIIPIYNKVNMS